MPVNADPDGGKRQRRGRASLSRRRVIGAVGGDGGADTTVCALCQALPSDPVAYDTDGTNVVFDFEYPASFEGEMIGLNEENEHSHRWNVLSEATSRGELSLTIRHNVEERELSTDPPSSNLETVADIEFDGVTVSFVDLAGPNDESTIEAHAEENSEELA